MNKQRLQQAIDIMTRVKQYDEDSPDTDRLYMNFWQLSTPDPRNGDPIFQHTEAELHSCGTGACFAGWVAVSPEFKAAGGRAGLYGVPELDDHDSCDAIARWLEIPTETARRLCGIGAYERPAPRWRVDVKAPALYPAIPLSEITPDLVIAALRKIEAAYDDAAAKQEG